MSEAERVLGPIVGDDEWARHRVLERLRREGLDRRGIEALAAELDEPDATRRAGARMALSALASPGSGSCADAQSVLRQALRSEQPSVRVLAATALGEAGEHSAGEALIEALEDPDPNVQAAAADALGELRHGPALEPLVRLSRTDDVWLRAGAVVALGRIRDERAVPALAEVAEEPSLAQSVCEALARIRHPSALPVLRGLMESAPAAALCSAGAVLSAHPDLDAPEWVRAGAREREEALREELERGEEPVAARLLGLAATPSAVATLLELMGPPRWSEAALAGLLAVPPETRAEAILERVRGAEDREAATLLSVLPPLTDPAAVRQLVPFLEAEDESVRAAAAEALSSAPAGESLPLLNRALAAERVSPEVVRAFGSLGEAACGSLLPLLGDPAPAVRSAAANALTRCASPAIAGELRAALEGEESPEVREALVVALALAVGEDALDVLDEALRSDRLDTRLAAYEGLGYTGSTAAVSRLEGALGAEGPERLTAIRSLGELGAAEGAPIVLGLIDDADPDTRRVAARACVLLASELGPEAIERLLRSEDPWVRLCGARVLGRRGEDGDRLMTLAERDPDPSVREAARQALAEGG